MDRFAELPAPIREPDRRPNSSLARPASERPGRPWRSLLYNGSCFASWTVGVRAAAMIEGERFMETALQTFVLIVQLALAGFLVWGGWLSLREALGGGPRGEQTISEAAPSAEPRGFERVASLVLLALLCSTLAAVA